jgi:predicted GIY-YIG superfamily endonuclease
LDHVVYILECGDGSFYTGVTIDLPQRVFQHREGLEPGAYTYSRRPVRLRWSQTFSNEQDAKAAERQIKGWTRAKKIALIEGGLDQVHALGRKRGVS